MNQKQLIILRGVSGSGKSSFCDLISEPKIICCADFFFESDGKYNFDASKLGQAHAKCREDFDNALANPYIDNIIIANVNSKPSDYRYYVDTATMAGAKITYVILEKRHHNVNVHTVPDYVLVRQASQLKQDIQLI